MGRMLAVAYGLVCYVAFFLAFVYAVGFVAGVGVPKGIDTGATGPLVAALVIDALLLGVFAVQHSVMARPAFKAVWTRIVPRPVERST
jgi:protein-S-isoprenylcysteine O-methyltransferase Ste14